MAAVNEHGKIIAAAAKAALAPIGCTRVSQSRKWISDERHWLIVIEFQPSGWSKGTYLNVGAMWLWRGLRGFAFNVGHRVCGFEDFVEAEQFRPIVAGMAAAAARRVLELRAQFPTIRTIADYLVVRAERNDLVDLFHAAIATGLAGQIEASRDLFRRLDDAETYGYGWCIELKQQGVAFGSLLSDALAFRSAVLDLMERTRRLTKLPPDPTCLEEATKGAQRRSSGV